jgi:hypothetical protein
VQVGAGVGELVYPQVIAPRQPSHCASDRDVGCAPPQRPGSTSEARPQYQMHGSACGYRTSNLSPAVAHGAAVFRRRADPQLRFREERVLTA